ncbi:MAG TPA: hypothetical protein VGP47_07735, partial [Parachlamydiaceae bacterium]|nr:hypothetical protein [Parachlamydiaceae bacterium]
MNSTPPFSLCRTGNFYFSDNMIAAGEQNNFFKIMSSISYGNGPDPITEIDQSKDAGQQLLAGLCLFTRQ